MSLHGDFSATCYMCEQPAMAADLETRRDPRGYRRQVGDVLLCQRCTWIVDHLPRKIGHQVGTYSPHWPVTGHWGNPR